MCAKEKLPYNACVFHKYTYKIGENVLCHWTQGPIHYDIHVDCHEGNEWHIYSVLRMLHQYNFKVAQLLNMMFYRDPDRMSNAFHA